MSRLKKIMIASVLLVAVFALTGFFVVPPVLKSLLVKNLSEKLRRSVALEAVGFNPFTLALSVKGFVVKERTGAGDFVSFQELLVNLEAMSLPKRALIINEIKLVKPYIHVSRDREGAYNFADLVPGEKPAEGKKEDRPFLFSFNNIRLIDGKIDFIDGPKETRHAAAEINVGIPFISNIDYNVSTFVKPSFAARIDGALYALEGQSKPFTTSRETDLAIDIRDLNIPYYLAYFPVKFNGKLLSAGLDVKAKLSYRQQKDQAPFLSLAGNVTLKNVALDDLNGKPLLRLPSLSVDMASVRPLAGEIHLARLALDAPEINVRKNEKGEINLLTLLPAREEKSKNVGETGLKEGTRSGEASGPNDGSKKEDGEKTVLDVDDLLVEKGKVTFADAGPRDPFNAVLGDIRLQASGISTAAGKEGKMSLTLSLPKKGKVSLAGPMTVEPLSTKLALNLKDLDIPTFQPYLSDVVNIKVTDGKISAAGNLLADSATGSLKTRYSGKVLVSRFASIDAAQAGDLLKWEAFYVNGIDAGINPLSVHIREIALTRLFARVLVREDGTLNLQNLMVAKQAAPVPSGPAAAEVKEKAPSTADATKASPEIKLDTVTLQGGEIDFTDKYIQPNFAGRFVELGGRISGLSSMETTRADVEIRGKLEGYAPLEITGKINPLAKDLFVDVKAAFKDMDLSPMTPYSGRYIGYTIQKGKLSFDLKYLIDRKKLDSINNIFIDQFNLGEKVESPQATKLPVSLAISLLKDRNDQIKLDIPVSGNLDDPQFSIWRIVLQVLVNLLTKAASAPFALLGTLFGGGEEMSFVEFDYGSAFPPEADLKKIQSLAKALKERPALKLDVEGYVDVEKDRETLKDKNFRNKLKAQKLKDEIRQGKEAVPLEKVVIGADEYERVLKMAYDAEPFPKPRDAAGRAKILQVPEMEKLMLTHIEVKDDDLRLLASQRALNVRDSLLASGEVTPDRVFLIETKFLLPPSKEKVKNSRVDFRLK
ncbi:MAG: DUF748 domain-containing protein [Deltaproteobacteria bacterium]|nr:DUF748 domain-containing protein [Deltaproteobacteria bacterium]